MNLEILVKPQFRWTGNNLPQRAHSGDAGVDLQADLEGPIHILPNNVVKIPTGLYIALPESPTDEPSFGWELQIRSRSGLASKGIVVANSPGTVDQGFRNEIMVLLANYSNDTFTVKPGDRIAQAILGVVAKFNWKIVNELPDSDRGIGGFGSTGV